MKKKLGGKFGAAMRIFGLVGQIAWVVENMYLNVFCIKCSMRRQQIFL